MTAFLDTNVLIRHLTADPPDMGAAATDFLGEATDLLLTDLVVAETVYVLESFYETPRAQVADSLRSIMASPSIITVDQPLLLRAVEVYEHDRLDFADAYLVACAESTDVNCVVSFDKTIDQVGTVERIEPTTTRRSQS